MSKLIQKISLKPGEKIKKTVHRSLWYWWKSVFLGLFFFFSSFFLIYPLFLGGKWGVVIFILLLILSIVLLFRVFFYYQKNIFVITNRRVVDLDHKGIFSSVVSSTGYSQIQDVTFHKKGLFKSILNLGDIFISFSGNQKVQLKIPMVKYPQQVSSLIMDYQQRYFLSKKSPAEIDKTLYTLTKIRKKLGDEAYQKLIRE